MKAAVFDRFGSPEEVLEIRELPVPEPGMGQVRVRMLASPINPSDLLVVRGQYGRLPTIPATPGFEGVGVIDAVGPGWLHWFRGLRQGRKVAVLNSKGGNWAEFVTLPARQVVPVPHDLPDEQVATFFVNPATALAMTRMVLKVQPGSWLLQTAPTSALGRMVIRLGKHYGFQTINLVRRKEQADELLALGADAVICPTAEDVPARLHALTGGAGVPCALDAVGGSMGLEAFQSLGPDGRLLVYGNLSGEPIPLPSRLLMVGQKRIEGFWLSEWVPKQDIFSMLRLFKQIISLLRKGVVTTTIGGSFFLDQVHEAVRQAETSGRKGKILLRLEKPSTHP